MRLYIDLSEFLAVPMKTGIQRIGGEICRYLPPGSATPIQLRSDHYVALPTALTEAVGRYFGDAGNSEVQVIRELCAAAEDQPLQLSSNDIVLVPEIFGAERAHFFRQMSDRQLRSCRFIVYDLLPFTHPEFFPPGMPAAMFGYFATVRRGSRCGFISEHTSNVYHDRLKRSSLREGCVLRLGCDSLGPRARSASLDRPLHFTVLGTIEPRKNHRLILEAFEPLLKQIKGLKLSFVGKMGWVEPDFARKVRALAADEHSGFSFHPAPDDHSIRRYIEQSRATIYVSAAEGYGLPPVESLWLGTPVIASKMIPSLENLGSEGIHLIDSLTVDHLRRAVLAFVDDHYANAKTEETIQLDLPTWQSFTRDVLAWCAAV